MVQLGAGVAALVLHAHNKVLALACLQSAHTEGRLLDEDLDTRDFVSMGAAAGVASAFDAPIGGVLFALEEVSTHWSPKLTWLAFFGALVAALTTQGLKTDWVSGVVTDEGMLFLASADGSSFSEAKYSIYELPIFAAVGTLGGLLGALFNNLNGRVNRARRRMYAEGGFVSRTFGKRTFQVVEALLLAWLVSTCFFVLPLFYPCVSVTQAIAGSEHADAKQAAAGALAESFLVDLRCADPHSYNQVASITLSSQHHVITALFTRRAAGVLFTPPALLVALGLVFSLTVIVYGATLPSGLFIPCMTMGALLGRCVGELVGQASAHFSHAIHLPFTAADAGFYALVGAGAMLSGVTRMTFSLTVILCEISNDAGSLLPLMVAVFAARLVGDSLNISPFDQAMTFAGYPFLEAEAERHFSKLTAEDVMTSNVVSLSEVETAERIVEVLQTTTHHAFPVVDGHI